MVIDGRFALFGSSNFDARSAQINEELDLAVDDESFGSEMEKIFEKDLAKSKRYTLEQFKNRSLWERTTEWLALPFRSQM
jgi:cardiolipin synthase